MTDYSDKYLRYRVFVATNVFVTIVFANMAFLKFISEVKRLLTKHFASDYSTLRMRKTNKQTTGRMRGW